jgi:hypothetical protein
MPTQALSARPPVRRSRPARQVVLDYVVQRDAAQRLSLALSLLARASGGTRVSGGGAAQCMPGEPVPLGLLDRAPEE